MSLCNDSGIIKKKGSVQNKVEDTGSQVESVRYMCVGERNDGMALEFLLEAANLATSFYSRDF